MVRHSLRTEDIQALKGRANENLLFKKKKKSSLAPSTYSSNLKLLTLKPCFKMIFNHSAQTYTLTSSASRAEENLPFHKTISRAVSCHAIVINGSHCPASHPHTTKPRHDTGICGSENLVKGKDKDPVIDL